MPRLPLLLVAGLLAACSASADMPPPHAPPTPAEPEVRAPTSVPAVGERPRNVVLLIADGFGPASATMGRSAAAALGRPFALDAMLTGSVETSPTDGRVTDSAASATAYACGLKTYNGAVGMTPERRPCRTVLEAAEARGMATGLVATSRITHATPASFAAHVEQRAQEPEIAVQMMASGVDVLFGGGLQFFAGRPDGRDLLGDARADGWSVATDRAGFDALDAAPAIALFGRGHMAYEVDREAAEQPSVAEMTARALDLLSAAGGDAGFFLMVEGSRIDHAGHANDPIGHLHDILAYDAAVGAALAWAEADGQTLVVSTADHETGGMTLARDGVYAWDPAPLLRATASFEGMASAIERGGDPAETLRAGLGVEALPDGAAEAVRAAFAAGDRASLSDLLDTLVSEPAGVGWTTGGHTAVDVGLYAAGPGAEAFAGALANDAVGRALFEVLGLAR